MKKLIVAVALLLIASIAFSVSAFGVNVSFGQKDYNLGDFTSTPPTLDGEFGRYEYTTVYTLTSAGGFVDKNGNALSAPMNSAAVTKSVKVGIAHDVSYIYIAIEAVIASDVDEVKYQINCREFSKELYAEGDTLENANDNEFSIFEKGVFVGEMRFAKNDYTDTEIVSEIIEASVPTNAVAVIDDPAVTSDTETATDTSATSDTETATDTAATSDTETATDTVATSDTETASIKYFDRYLVTEGEFELAIFEETKDWRDNVINYTVWNAVRVNSFNKMLNNGNDFAYNTFTIGESASKVTVQNNITTRPAPTTRPPVTTTQPATTTTPTTTAEPVTTLPDTTAEPETTTEPETTVPAESEPDTTVTTPETTVPVQSESQSQSAPAVTEPAKSGSCKNSVTGMGIALVSLIGACVTVISKKED